MQENSHSMSKENIYEMRMPNASKVQASSFLIMLLSRVIHRIFSPTFSSVILPKLEATFPREIRKLIVCLLLT